MKKLLLCLFLVSCTSEKSPENPHCVDGYVIATKEFGFGFCREIHSNGTGNWGVGCTGFEGLITSGTTSQMLLNGNVILDEAKCFDTDKE